MIVATISGPAQNGKDTLAEMIKESVSELSPDKNVMIIHFADFLKFAAKQWYGWDGVKDEKGRTLLQYLGTDVVRKNSPDCWVNIVKELLIGLGDTIDIVLIPDARFPNEITIWKEVPQIKELITIKIVRDGFDNGLTEKQKQHPSETALKDFTFDVTIHNNGSLDAYREKAKELARDLIATA